MRKISIICRCLRSFYPAIFAGLAITCWVAQDGYCNIAPLENPMPQPPPPQSSSGREYFEQQKRRDIEEAAKQKSSEQSREKMQVRDQQHAFLQSRLFAGFGDLSLFVGKANVSEGRSDYRVDPGIHASTYARAFWSYRIRDVQPWFGLRAAPFGGFGTQNMRTARFAHTWIGPAFGFGKFIMEDDRADPGTPSYLLLVSGGFAGVSRLSNPSETEKSPPKDFKPCAWCQDASGAWLEFRYTRLDSDVIGIGGLMGIQTGSGKIFTYAGVSISGFY